MSRDYEVILVLSDSGQARSGGSFVKANASEYLPPNETSTIFFSE